MDEESRQALDEFAARVRQRFPQARVWAYGSRARGGETPESDLDVCVVVDRLDEQVRKQLSEISWRVGFERGLVLSTVVYSRKEFEDGPCSESPLVLSILEEGVPA